MGTTTFNAMEIDAIGEIMNISIGASATAVSTMLGTATNITTPIVSVETRSQFNFKELEPAIGVEISYVKGLSGRNVMMFSRDDVRVIVGMMMGQEIPPEEFEMNELNESAIREVMNMMMGSSATALSEFLGYTVDISTPVSFEIHNANEFKDKYFPNDEPQVVVRFSLEIGDKLSSEFLNIMGTDLAKKLLEPYADSLGSGGSDESGQPAEEAPAEAAPAAEEAPAEPQAEAAPAAGDGGSDKPLDQNATDALLASLKSQNAVDASAANAQEMAAEAREAEAQKEQTISDEEAKAQYESMTKGQRPLSQGETDAILASLKNQAAEEGTAEAQPETPGTPAGGSDKPLDQNATDALLASLKAGNAEASQPAAAQAAPQNTAQAAPQNAAQAAPQAAQAAPQNAAQAAPQNTAQAAPQAAQPAQAQNAAPQMTQQGYAPQGYPQQGYAPQQPYMQPYYAPQPQAYAPQPDPTMTKLLQSMQESQAQMMQLLAHMNDDQKQERERREKEEREREERAAEEKKEASRRDKEAKPMLFRNLHSPEYADIPATGETEEENREMLMKVPLEISVEIGRTMKPIKDILELTQGSLVVLDKMAGEQADLYVNGECIARGDVVVVEDNFGIRITEILNKDMYREEI